MSTKEIIKEINNLPVNKRLMIIEQTLHSIREEDSNNQMKTAVDTLYNDYKTDKELTAFSNLDFEDL